MSTTPILPFKNNFYSDNQPPRTAALSGKNKADVVIVGGGIVGLCSAYTLREEGLDVVVLEREHVGFGTWLPPGIEVMDRTNVGTAYEFRFLDHDKILFSGSQCPRVNAEPR